MTFGLMMSEVQLLTLFLFKYITYLNFINTKSKLIKIIQLSMYLQMSKDIQTSTFLNLDEIKKFSNK